MYVCVRTCVDVCVCVSTSCLRTYMCRCVCICLVCVHTYVDVCVCIRTCVCERTCTCVCEREEVLGFRVKRRDSKTFLETMCGECWSLGVTPKQTPSGS